MNCAFLYPEVTEKICRVPYPLIIFTPLSIHGSTFFGLSTNEFDVKTNKFPENLLINQKANPIMLLVSRRFLDSSVKKPRPILADCHRRNKGSNNSAKDNITR